MIVRTLQDIIDTDRDVHAPTWDSRRLLLAKDRVGFSMHDTTIHAGTETFMWYKHHLEAVYCVAGEGELEDIDNGATYPVSDGTVYTLNGNERHVLRARTEMRMICVFTPPLVGKEVHDEDGIYPLLSDDAEPASVS